jgi:hypothetical protein
MNKGSTIILILAFLIIIATIAGIYGSIQLIIWLLYVTLFYPLHMLISLTVTALLVYIIYRIRTRLPKDSFVYSRKQIK